MTSLRLPYLSSRLQGFGTTIFAEMTRLALEHGALNLGQGFPDFDAPEEVKQAAQRAIAEGNNQYARSFGVPLLNQAIADHQAHYRGLSYDPTQEITVYSGATEAICATLQALCETGDEVLMFEPFYDSYRASVAMAGAVSRVVTLSPGKAGFAYAAAELEAAITGKTRLILLNTPHNPTGKVFSRAELEHIAELCRRHDLLAVTDEVYEHLVYEGEHVCLASLPGMRERTVVISSAGKTFSCTGWKVGWTCAPPDLTRALRSAHQFITFATATPLQHAVAHALSLGDGYFDQLRADYRARRDLLSAGLRDVGFGVIEPRGSYFICADIRDLGFDSGTQLCLALPRVAGVVAIPNAAFYLEPNRGDMLVRFAFCKTRDVLEQSVERLRASMGRLRAEAHDMAAAAEAGL
ncbi:MAG: aminotransferase class I/II-fold pyridoxal phosphate-dependent enzyme [Myxococcales bacterium]|nr:aminotransferase class I/II-fold pyridoxal phosphate-dependent enzyme [Myxococcales bacterium]